MQEIEIIGAKKHNLKNISLKIPKRQLITITGVSGSGKSTLAYDTLFQEGQRKYLESLSIYARQFLKSLEKPEVQTIKGISPTISIDQKHSSFYYNSTVGTLAEVSPYLRLLLARVGEAHCPHCGKPIHPYSITEITAYLFTTLPNHLVYILTPIVKNRKGNHHTLLEKYQKRGFLKAHIDGDMVYLDELPELRATTNHNIAIQIDALKIKPENRQRIADSLSLAAFESNGEIILREGDRSFFFSNKLYCGDCHVGLPEPQPALFSLNSPVGVCETCQGRGTKNETPSQLCPECQGSGFNALARAFYFRGKNIFELGEMAIDELLPFFQGVTLRDDEEIILSAVFPQIIQRLESMVRLKLGYITLNRKITTLSGGELQRTRLVSQIGFSLSGIIYILDEPSIGMHMTEQQHLLEILKQLKEKDNTIIVVEHDEETIKNSDYIIDMGPGAGDQGGYITYCGPYSNLAQAKDSLTADYIFKRKTTSITKPYEFHLSENNAIHINTISINNIHEVNVSIPLHGLTVVTGVSGSGKSSLLIDGVFPILKEVLTGTGKSSQVTGLDTLARVQMVTQTAIGKTARSCPATYIDIMPGIRELFAGLTEARIRGYEAARFGFNSSGGRCEACKGMGVKKLAMSFLPELVVPCPVCEGKRYNSETLKIKYNGLSIAQVLELTAAEAYELFGAFPHLAKKIKILVDVGLGYLKLGQSSLTLSGGESQRIKLTRELTRISAKPTLYILDEPTIGLHFDDIRQLLAVFFGLITRGHTVVVIEHNLEVIKNADYIIDMGPGGGKHGGQILYQGPVSGLPHVPASATGKCLKII